MKFSTDNLDISLAIRRVKRDMRDDWFADPLRYSDILAVKNIEDWFADDCEIHRTEALNIPKPGFVIRSAHEMNIYERVMYQALIDHLIEKYDQLLRPSVYSHRLQIGRKNYIFQNTIDAWKAFNDDTDAALDSDSKVLVKTDIQNYYQCIHYDTLCDQLLADEPNADESFLGTISQLRSLLNGWNSNGVGLPQNRDASSFLGNIFLRGVDEHMILKGYNYMRYMDDVHIVCSDVFEARKALQEFIIKLRDYDLGVNGKKTKLLLRTDKDYREEIPSRNEELEEIDSLFKQRNVRSVRKAREKLDKFADILLAGGKTGGKEFRFCIHRIERLARCEDIHYDASRFVDAAIDLLVEQPWSTEMLVGLFRSSSSSHTHDQTRRIVDFALCEKRNIYDWQSYVMWHLLAIINTTYRKDDIKQAARNAVSGNRSAPYKSGAALYIGACGNQHDKRHLLQESAGAQSNMLSRAVSIATQEVRSPTDRALRDAVVPLYYRESTDRYRESKLGSHFFSPFPSLKAYQIYNDLPCFYF